MPHTVFSKRYPPRNRVETGLGPVELEIVAGEGTLRFDPNRGAVMGWKRELAVSEPRHTSALSGAPGFLYRTGDGVEVALTREELLRLLRRELEPCEVLKLHALYGAFFETHDDFYDEDTGQALQPMSER